MWRVGVALADAGWFATAVDLRGHGTAPRALDYSIAAYAADLDATRPARGGWDVVVGHSLGGAASIVAAAADPLWTTRLILIDPAITLSERNRQIIYDSQDRAFADTSIAAIAADHPQWHPHDIELKSLAASEASRWAVEQTGIQNTPWDVSDETSRLQIPTHVIAGDPAVYALFRGRVEQRALENPHVTSSIIPGAGHSPHRDRPVATIAELLARIPS